MTYLDLFEDPSFPHWGRSIILQAVDRDPVDFVNVLEAILEAGKEDLARLQQAAHTAQLISDAAEASERFGDDAIEAYAASKRGGDQ